MGTRRISASARRGRVRGDPVATLVEIARSFGSRAAREKRRRIEALLRRPHMAPSKLVALQELALFLQAYPDDAGVRTAARELGARVRTWSSALTRRERMHLADTGLPETDVVDTFGYPLLRRLTRLHPGALEIDWASFEDSGPLQLAVSRLLLGAEAPGLDDVTLDWDDWFQAVRGADPRPELELLLELFARARLTPAECEWRFDGCGVPVRWSLTRPGSARVELVRSTPRPAWRGHAPAPLRGALAPLVRRPLSARRLAPAQGAAFVDFGAAALAVRQSEIRPLSAGNAHDVHLADCGGGLVVALIGVRRDYREPLESLYTSLLLMNGVPIAYGPASVAAGCCEMGLNLFEEFRGLETRRIYAGYMRAIHHVLGAQHFFLTPYGMGVGNPEALAAGSFWFYRRLGFRPTSLAVEELARAEEARFAREQGARSSLTTLRKLAETSVGFGLVRVPPAPLPLGHLGLAVTRRIREEYGGDRERAGRRDAELLARALGLGRSVPRATLELVAPVLALDRDLARRPRGERARLARFVRLKAAPSEAGADAQLRAARSVLAALRAAAGTGPVSTRNPR